MSTPSPPAAAKEGPGHSVRKQGRMHRRTADLTGHRADNPL